MDDERDERPAPPRPRPARESPAPPPPPGRDARQPEGATGSGETARPDAGAARPTPVREGLEKGTSTAPEVSPEPPPSRRDFEDLEGRVWTAEVAGRGRSGQIADPGAPLLLILFRPPEGDPERTEVLEVLTVGRELDDLSDQRLGELVLTATPTGFEPGEFFPDTHRGRGGS